MNAVGDCNGCHTSGTNGTPYPYAVGFNPYFGQQLTKVDPTVYLSGGQDFGQVAIDANFNPIGPHIISRNLTPNYAGLLKGGNTLEQFLQTNSARAGPRPPASPLLDDALQPELPFCSPRTESGGCRTCLPSTFT